MQGWGEPSGQNLISQDRAARTDWDTIGEHGEGNDILSEGHVRRKRCKTRLVMVFRECAKNRYVLATISTRMHACRAGTNLAVCSDGCDRLQQIAHASGSILEGSDKWKVPDGHQQDSAEREADSLVQRVIQHRVQDLLIPASRLRVPVVRFTYVEDIGGCVEGLQQPRIQIRDRVDSEPVD